MAPELTDAERLDRIEEAVVQLAHRHRAMLGTMGPRSPVLDELIFDVEERLAAAAQ